MWRLDELNPALWLAGQQDKMELSCCAQQEKFPQKPYNKSFIDQAWLASCSFQKGLADHPARSWERG